MLPKIIFMIKISLFLYLRIKKITFGNSFFFPSSINFINSSFEFNLLVEFAVELIVIKLEAVELLCTSGKIRFAVELDNMLFESGSETCPRL